MSIDFWQIKNWNYLTQQRQKATLSSSLLLWGQKGLGVMAFAEKFSTWLLCENKKHQNLPCERCVSCQWIMAGTHPDRLIIMPESNSTSIKVDAIREIRRFCDKKSQTGSDRVVLISPSEAMNVSAANALLKTLEEPFDNTFFLLVSTHRASLLPTILSRCQKIYFPPLNKEHFFMAMQHQNMPLNRLDTLYELSHGEPFAFPSVKHQETAVLTEQKLVTLMEQWCKKQVSSIHAAEQIKVIEKDSHLSFENLMDMLLDWVYRQVINAAKISLLGIYEFYDKLLVMKSHLRENTPINQLLWLEELFFSTEKFFST